MGQRSGDSASPASGGSKRKPAARTAATTTRRRATSKPAVEPPTGPKVLLVDDDAEVRDWLRLSLSLRGWLVEEAETGDEALERVDRLAPDVVLLDHQMPGMKGIECAARLRNASSDLRIIMASGLIDAVLTRRARELQILPIEKADHARLFDLFELLAEQIRMSGASVS